MKLVTPVLALLATPLPAQDLNDPEFQLVVTEACNVNAFALARTLHMIEQGVGFRYVSAFVNMTMGEVMAVGNAATGNPVDRGQHVLWYTQNLKDQLDAGTAAAQIVSDHYDGCVAGVFPPDTEGG